MWVNRASKQSDNCLLEAGTADSFSYDVMVNDSSSFTLTLSEYAGGRCQ